MNQRLKEQGVQRLVGALVRVLYHNKDYRVQALAIHLNYDPQQLEKDLIALESVYEREKRKGR